MYVDALLRFSNAQAVTATAVSTDVLDLGVDGNLGIGEPMALVIIVDVALDDGDADETYSFELQADSTSAFSSAVAIASATGTRGDVAGTKYVIGVPASSAGEQFLRVNYVHGGTTPTGTYTAFLIPQSMVQNDVVYADNITIS
jgi:hypothetical protein